MIAVLVADDNAVDVLGRFADRRQSGDRLAAAETGINENPRTSGGYERAVAGAAAGEHTNLDDNCLPELFL